MKFCKINKKKSYDHCEIDIKKWIKLIIAHKKATPAPSMVNLSKHQQNFRLRGVSPAVKKVMQHKI